MKVTKDSFSGMVTYNLPNGKTFKVPYKNHNYCVAADGDEVPSTWGGKTYIYMYDYTKRHHDHYCFEDDTSSDVAPWDKQKL